MGAASAGRWGRGVAAAVLAGYLAVVAYGVFGSSPRDQIETAAEGARKVAGEIEEAVPGARRVEEASRSAGGGYFGGINEENVANIALFVPLGLLFPAVFPHWRWWTVPAGMTLTAAIEGIQLVFLSWRSPSVEDMVWNSLGAVIGFALWLMASWIAGIRKRSCPSP